MFKFVIVAVALCSYGVLAAPNPEAKAEAKPGVLAATPLVAAAPAVAPAIVTAQSSQAIISNYNALAAPLVAAPLAASPYVASPYVASPYVASPYIASPYVAPYFDPPYLI